MKLTFVVPCYNEEKNIKLFFEDLKKSFIKNKYKIEIIFINDGSKDNTLKELINLFNTIERKQFLYKLMDVEGIAEITAKYVYSGIEENYNTIKF